MEIGDIIKDSFKYPLSDYKKFLKLGIPNLILAIITFLLGYNTYMTSKGIYSGNVTVNSYLTTILGTFVIIYILIMIFEMINSGIGISVIRETIKPSDNIPDIDLKNNFLDGLKSFIIALVYFLVPTIIFGILTAICLGLLGKNSGVIIIILMLVYAVVSVFVFLMVSVSMSRLAETNSLSESIKYKDILEISKSIGIEKIFVTFLVISFINFVLNFIATLILGYLSTIGLIILFFIVYTYILLTSFRACGLLYRERNVFNNNYQQQENIYDNNQQGNVQIGENNDEVSDLNSNNN